MAYRSINPYTENVIAEFPYISEKELSLAIERSHNAFLSWKKTDLLQRTRLLNNLADLLERDAQEHAAIMTSEMGKPYQQAVAEAMKSALACRYYANEAERILTPRIIDTEKSRSRIIYEPQGIVFAVMPWNYPYWQVIRCLAPAIVSGNSMLLKHASNVPRCALKIESTMLEAGFPEALFQNLFIDHKMTSEVIASRFVRTISLTGSNTAGEIIAARAGASTKKCVLELGGSDPFIVFEDANIESAAEAAVTGRFLNNGQSCIAAKRLFIHEDIYDAFLIIFREKVSNLRVGDPMRKETDIGPLVNRHAVTQLRSQVSRSIDMGAEVKLGSLISSHGEMFFDPMIIENVSSDSPVAVEETFGPVIPLFKFSSYDKMISMVNSSVFGLGSSVWTNDSELISRISGDIDAGTVSINGYTRSDPALPFGGVKSSGYGRELSDNGIFEFLNIKTVSVFSS